MKEFFKVRNLEEVISCTGEFSPVGTEEILLEDALGRILGADVVSNMDLPDFPRSTMDGYAVFAQATFGASEANPAFLTLAGSVAMGEIPSFSISRLETAKIFTGGMLPKGADAVVMVEHIQTVDDSAIEVYRSVAPGQNMIMVGEDFKKDEVVLKKGEKIRPQELGLLAAMGMGRITVFKKPVVGIISTGDEIVSIRENPGPGQLRDINSHTLSALAAASGAVPNIYGIVKDDFHDLLRKCERALAESDMVLISGGSSVGARDFTISVLSSLAEASILVHGISISPGKPTILAKVLGKPFFGLPGHVVSAMVVFDVVVRPFLERISGRIPCTRWKIPAVLDRNIASAQGRTDFIRVRLSRTEGMARAHPVLGKSGLIRTMVKADGLIEIDANTEGLDKGAVVDVILV